MRSTGYILSNSKFLSAAFLVLLLSINFAVIFGQKAQASSTYSANSTGTCPANSANQNSSRPSPYSGGAGIARVFYPDDGSTITVTTTGAVIKQSPCATPYRQGWINPAEICNLNSAADLSGRLAAGNSNPYAANAANRYSYNCATKPSTATTHTVNTVYVKSASSNTPAVAATPKPPVVNTPAKADVLPNTGPGDVLALGGISSVLGAIGHFFYKNRRALSA